VGLTLAVTATSFAAIEIRLKNGSRWKGDLNDRVEVQYKHAGVEMQIDGDLKKVEDLYIVVHGEFAGKVQDRTIFRSDITSMRSAQGGQDTSTSTAVTAKSTSEKAQPSASGGSVEGQGAGPHVGGAMGVFVLPLDGMVGEGFRHQEIDAVGEEADKYGPGQIIVLIINSNGGLVLESEMVTESIWKLKDRHRVVAWVNKAISAGCSTAMVCDEIYFMTEGTAGSVTTIRGMQHVPEEQAQPGIDYLVELARRAGYSEHIARAMKLTKYMCSYDKDPVTGDVTFYGDTSGEFVLSDGEQNLCFNSSNALHCGFSKGTVDTEQEMADSLDLAEWNEISQYGREIAADWQSTVEDAKEDIQRQIARLEYYKTGGGDPKEVLGARIQILKKLIAYWNKAPNVCYLMGLPEKSFFERQIAELRKQLADIRRAERRR
jgi:hypothetical protein